MSVKRKDFQKTAAYIHQFLLKLDFGSECAEVRDALNLALLHMQKYFRHLRRSTESKDRDSVSNVSLSNASLRGLSPMTPFKDSVDRFRWRWHELESKRTAHSSPDSSVPALHAACRTGSLQSLKTLLSSGMTMHSIDVADRIGRTALMYCIHFNQLQAAEWLLKAGASTAAADNDHTTALHIAAHHGYWQLLELLLQHGADPNLQDDFGRAAIHWAVTTTSTECLKILMQYKANPGIRDCDDTSPSMWACRLDHIDHLNVLSRSLKVDDYPDGFERDRQGRTIVHWAVRRQEPLECLNTLVTENNAGILDNNGRNVLLTAAEQGSLPACKMIVDICGTAIIDDHDHDRRTALHLATIGGHGEVVNFLLDQGANMDIIDAEGCKAWQYAQQKHLNYCYLILASHSRQRSREVELASQNSLQEPMLMNDSMQLDASMPKPPSTPPSRSKSPSARRRLRGLVSRETSANEAADADGDGDAEANYEQFGFDRKESDDFGENLPHVHASDPLLGLIGANDALSEAGNDDSQHGQGFTYRDCGDSPPMQASPPPTHRSASAAAAKSRRSSSGGGSGSRGGSATAAPLIASPERRLQRSQEPYRLQRPAAAAAAAAAAAPAPAPPPPFQEASPGFANSVLNSDQHHIGNSTQQSPDLSHPPRTPPDRHRSTGPPAQLLPLQLMQQRGVSSAGTAAGSSGRKKKKKRRANTDSAQAAADGQRSAAALRHTTPPLQQQQQQQQQQKQINGFAALSPPGPLAPLSPRSNQYQLQQQQQQQQQQHPQQQQLEQEALNADWLHNQHGLDTTPAVTPRSFIPPPPPFGFGNSSAEHSPQRSASPMNAASAAAAALAAQPSVVSSDVTRGSVYLPSPGKPRPTRASTAAHIRNQQQQQQPQQQQQQHSQF